MKQVCILFLMVCLIQCALTDKKSGAISMDHIKLTDLSGNSINLDSYKGKTVFINVWATWCKPCLQEMPTLAIAKDRLKEEPIVFLFASNESLDQIAKFKNKQTFDFQYVHLTNMEELSIQALPTTFIFDAQGELKFSEVGFRQWNDSVSMNLLNEIINQHE
jgi:thiol-disulfide isomerase/thioredoxin